MSDITLSHKSTSFDNANLNQFARIDSNKKLTNIDINNFYKSRSIQRPKLLEKIVAFSCYFTFGLSGIILLIANFISDGLVSKFTYLHTFQSLIFGIAVGVLSFSLALFTNTTSIFFNSIEAYQNYSSLVFFSLELFVGIAISTFALFALFGKKCYLPGLEKLARKFVN